MGVLSFICLISLLPGDPIPKRSRGKNTAETARPDLELGNLNGNLSPDWKFSPK